jgi:hypothetical protein
MMKSDQIGHSKNSWKINKMKSKISPTSVASERAFSISGAFVTKRRSGLSDKSIDDLFS